MLKEDSVNEQAELQMVYNEDNVLHNDNCYFSDPIVKQEAILNK